MYLGRVERRNSWGMALQPVALLRAISGDLLHPFREDLAWKLSLLFGAALYVLYALLPVLLKVNDPEADGSDSR